MSQPKQFRMQPTDEENIAVAQHFQAGMDDTAVIRAALQLYAEMSADTGDVLKFRREYRKANIKTQLKRVDKLTKKTKRAARRPAAPETEEK